MHLPETSRFELTSNLTICRILNGMWQVSGAHGYIEPKRAVEEMFIYHDAGFTTGDLADHYGPAEDFVGEFRKEFAARRGRERLSEIQAFTKWVPRPGPMTRRIVDEAIRTSRMRMGIESLDLLQFFHRVANRNSWCETIAGASDSVSGDSVILVDTVAANADRTD
jgi:aryl-alcohol dehydrogenase-like predicted oxidoreductase